MRANIPFHFPVMRTARGRHLLELLAAILLIVVVALGIAYWLSTRTVPAPAANTRLTAAAMRFADMKQRQAEAREPILAPAPSTSVTPGATRFADMKQRQAEAREPMPAVPVVPVNPATQSVLDYLRAHSSVPMAAAPVDPATQSVLDYLRVHASIRPAAVPVDPATQSVLDYLRVHSSLSTAVPSAPAAPIDLDDQHPLPNLPASHAAPVKPIDPATQSVLDYLRVHGN